MSAGNNDQFAAITQSKLNENLWQQALTISGESFNVNLVTTCFIHPIWRNVIHLLAPRNFFEPWYQKQKFDININLNSKTFNAKCYPRSLVIHPVEEVRKNTGDDKMIVSFLSTASRSPSIIISYDNQISKVVQRQLWFFGNKLISDLSDRSLEANPKFIQILNWQTIHPSKYRLVIRFRMLHSMIQHPTSSSSWKVGEHWDSWPKKTNFDCRFLFLATV